MEIGTMEIVKWKMGMEIVKLGNGYREMDIKKWKLGNGSCEIRIGK